VRDTGLHVGTTARFSGVISKLLSISIGVDLLPRPSVGLSVCLSVCAESVLWQNGRLYPDAVWGDERGWSRDERIRRGWSSSKRKGQFWGKCWASHCNQRGLCCVVVRALFPDTLGEDLFCVV